MRIGLDVSSIQHLRLRDYAVRFVFGGIVTVLTGLIARRYVAGRRTLPRISSDLSAGATLIEKQQRRKSGELVSMALQEAESSQASMQSGRRWGLWG